MMARRGAIGLMLAAGSALLAGCGMLFPYRYRARVSVEVNTPQGVRRGSSVYEETTHKSPALLPDEHVRALQIKGEAVAVDLPGGQVLFMLVPDASWLQAALDPGWNNDWVESGARIAGGRTPRGVIDVSLSPAKVTGAPPPLLVRFGDIHDPRTVEAVAPGDLAASFGPGVTLQRITVTVTDDAVTSGIEKRLGWLPKYYGLLFNGERYEKITPNLAGHLGAGDFSTELSK